MEVEITRKTETEGREGETDEAEIRKETEYAAEH